MSTYKEIKGLAIQTLASDPSTLYKGQTWYNTTDEKLRVRTLGAAAWSVGGTNPDGAEPSCAAGGISSDAVIVGGGGPSPTSATTNEYNGSAWSEMTSMIIGRTSTSGFGSGTTLMVASGSTTGPGAGNVANCETFNGSAWSETVNLGSSRYQTTGVGSTANTTGLIVGGSPGYTGKTEEWNGIAWTEKGDAIHGRDMMSRKGPGTVTAALVAAGRGGYPSSPHPQYNAEVEEFNGIAWSEQDNLISACTGPFGFGVVTDGVVGGGSAPTALTSVELYNGTTWSSGTAFPGPGMAGNTGTGTASNALVSASATGITGASFEYVKGAVTQDVTTS